MHYETQDIQHLLNMLQSPSKENQQLAQELIKSRLKIKKWISAEKAFFAALDDHALCAYCERMYQKTRHTGIALVRAFFKRVCKEYKETVVEFQSLQQKLEWLGMQNSTLKLPFYCRIDKIDYTSPNGVTVSLTIQIERALEFSF
jgi:hypothetical protein